MFAPCRPLCSFLERGLPLFSRLRIWIRSFFSAPLKRNFANASSWTLIFSVDLSYNTKLTFADLGYNSLTTVHLNALLIEFSYRHLQAELYFGRIAPVGHVHETIYGKSMESGERRFRFYKNRVDESSIIVYNAREAMETNHKEDAYAPGEERCENPEREARIPCL